MNCTEADRYSLLAPKDMLYEYDAYRNLELSDISIRRKTHVKK